ncbi:phenylacetic acid degradation protein [Pseudovibrio japonicus]|uniref:Phenylacetic acid degradation protein n=1 Tax=Pseudovibrio japonicus TaxID=366534 RepID=A0ABQ3E1G2_9HYPH|nr:1,2-phenylacetyl-CoA epoxidase subunit PaaE [Pseudovibrio japonicus]GHB20399.1 phenylacetic acid degradation protein [Pseudovibrio japonicus]
MSPRFHRLKIKSVHQETEEAVSIAFEIPDDLKEDYSFIPGQYLTLREFINGEDTRRSYSICSSPKDDDIRVAIKKVEGGRFSSFALGHVAVGDEIDVMTPMGRFNLPRKTTGDARVYAAFAAGSGITPIMSMVQAVLEDEPNSQFFLFYGNKNSQSVIFKDELDDLKDRFLDRLSVYHVLSREEQELSLFNGRLTAEKVDEFITKTIGENTIDHVFLCGPGDMIEAAKQTCQNHGIPLEHIHNELFVPADGSDPHAAHKAKDSKAVDHASKVSMIVDGARHEVTLQPGETIIDGALRMGIEAPFSCKGGMCCTCRAKVVSGEVDMAVNYSLEPWEIEAGYVLTCQSRPKTDDVTVDYDDI